MELFFSLMYIRLMPCQINLLQNDLYASMGYMESVTPVYQTNTAFAQVGFAFDTTCFPVCNNSFRLFRNLPVCFSLNVFELCQQDNSCYLR